ncbi:hypothetical protein Taro_005764 [Colocasia esculenta]|uniref:Uncharacterized protein n=1 Tax=Colocasia esculenta TaxID=4460 RepID=A0A843TP50_COLES|nr:hypothetical protein [Colocasia esculenta]
MPISKGVEAKFGVQNPPSLLQALKSLMAKKRAPSASMGGEASYEGPKHARTSYSELLRLTEVPNHLSSNANMREATILQEEVEEFMALPKTTRGDEHKICHIVEPIDPKLILGGPLYGSMILLEYWLEVRIKFKPVENPTTESRIFGGHPLCFIGGMAKFSNHVVCRTADKKTRSAWRLCLNTLPIEHFAMDIAVLRGVDIRLPLGR